MITIKLNKNETETLIKIIGEVRNKKITEKEQMEIDYEYLSNEEKVEMFSDIAIELITLTAIEDKLK